MEFFFHVGPHKTASSYLQRAFLSEKDYLQKKGIYYPTEFIPPNLFGQHLLVRALRKNELKPLINNFDAFKLKYSKVLISSEGLAELNLNQLQKLKDCLPKEAKISIIYFIRSISGLIPSRWQETVKHGKFHSFESYYLNHLNSMSRSNIISYKRNLDRLSKVFDKNLITLIDYDHLVNKKVNFVEFFFSNVFDIKLQETYSKRVNISINKYEIEILRGLNFLHFKKHSKFTSLIRKLFFKELRSNNWGLSLEVKAILDQHFKTILINPISLPISISKKKLHANYIENFKFQEVSLFENTSSKKEIEVCDNLVLKNNYYYKYLTNIYKKITTDDKNRSKII